jgi:F-type H+-transporting ATPase subunit b
MVLASLTEAAAAAHVSAPEAVDVDVNLTFLVQVGLFVVLMLVLKPVLFDPMLKLFEEREKRIEGAKVQARRLDEKSGVALSEYEKAMAKARGEANAERDRVRAEGLKKEAEILSQVRTETAKLLEDGKKRAQEQAATVRSRLRGDAAQLASNVASRVLGREVQG